MNVSKKYSLVIVLKLFLFKIGIKNVWSRVTYPGTDFVVKIRFNRIWEELSRSRWESNTIKFITTKIKPGDILLDVGAYIGPYTILFSQLASNSGKVYAFEPNPVAYGTLAQNIKTNRIENVQIEWLAVSNRIGKTKLFIKEVGDTLSFIEHTSRNESNWRHIEVCTTTLDDYCEKNSIVPNGIKIDVEGAEGLIFNGGWRTIEEHKPWVLLEFHRIFLNEHEIRNLWAQILNKAEKIIYLDGLGNKYQFGEKVESIPDGGVFYVFITF